MPYTKILNKYHPISTEEAVELYKRANEGDQDANEKLYYSVVCLISRFASNYAMVGGAKDYQTYEELFAEGSVGFMRAIRANSFDPQKAGWTTFVGSWIRGSILTHILRKANMITTPSHLPRAKRRVVISINELHDFEGCFLDNTNAEKDAKAELLAEKVVQLIRHELSYRDAQILIARYFNKERLAPIGKRFGISAERVRQLQNKALRKLSALMEGE